MTEYKYKYTKEALEKMRKGGAKGGRAKVKKGFGAMSKEKLLELSAKGGRSSRDKGEIYYKSKTRED